MTIYSNPCWCPLTSLRQPFNPSWMVFVQDCPSYTVPWWTSKISRTLWLMWAKTGNKASTPLRTWKMWRTLLFNTVSWPLLWKTWRTFSLVILGFKRNFRSLQGVFCSLFVETRPSQFGSLVLHAVVFFLFSPRDRGRNPAAHRTGWASAGP